MRNLFRAECYRMRTSKMVWWLVIGYFLLSMVSLALNGMLFGTADWILQIKSIFVETASQSEVAASVLTILNSFTSATVETYTDFIQESVGTNIFLIMTLFISLFIIAQKTSGYIKNMIPFYTRKQIFVVNVVLTVVFVLILDLVYFLTSIVIWLIFFKDFNLGYLWYAYLPLMLLLTIVGSMFIYCLCDMFKNPKIGMILTLIYTAGLSTYVYKFIDLLFAVVNTNFKIEYVMPLGIMSAFNMHDIMSLICGSVCMIIYGGISYYYLYNANLKRDL